MMSLIRLFLLLPLASLLGACDMASSPTAADQTAADVPERGPNDGRLLTDGDFAVELAIYETGLPPELRAWVTDAGRPVEPEQVDLTVTLTRLGNETNVIDFLPEDDFLRGTQPVDEPHSFVVSVEAKHDGRRHEWEYESFEGRTRISPEMAEAFGLETESAGSAVLTQTLTLYGRIVPSPDRIRQVSARFDGAIRSVEVAPGDAVREGQTLAEIESNESLRPYTIVAPIAGIVTERNANAGEQTAGRRLFTIVDTSFVWANLAVFVGDRDRVRVGAPVTLTSTLGGGTVEGTISYVSVLADTNQAVAARVEFDNASGQWALGTYVTAEVVVDEKEVPLAVRRSALQTFRDLPVVYVQVGEEYEVRMLELGMRDDEWVEVLGGLKPGTRYVTKGSYVLKADVEKSGAAHDH